MNNSTYDFGYSWLVTYGHLVPLAGAAALAGVALWRGWPRIVIGLAAIVGVWALAGFAVMHLMLARPMTLPTERFLASGEGRVLDVGAGSGRAGVGVLLARPNATVTALDIYSGYWGIDDNTPQRFMANARAAGAAARAEARTGDMREMPFGGAEFDAAISSYAVDHVPRRDTPKALAEVARVLKPGGEFLLMIVNSNDWLVRLLSPPIAHHPRQDPARWRQMLEDAGFRLEEDGTTFGTYYFYARKVEPPGLSPASGARSDRSPGRPPAHVQARAAVPAAPVVRRITTAVHRLHRVFHQHYQAWRHTRG